MVHHGLCLAQPLLAKSVGWIDAQYPVFGCSMAICSTYHTLLKASPGAAIFGQDVLFGIPFIAHWRKFGEHRQ